MEEQATITIPHEEENENQRYDLNFEFCKDHVSLQLYDFPSNSHNVNDVTRISNVDMHANKETCAMNLCHKQVDLICQPLYEEYLVECLPFQPHHLSGSLREN